MISKTARFVVSKHPGGFETKLFCINVVFIKYFKKILCIYLDVVLIKCSIKKLYF